jgi:hypothetical protein
MGRALRTVLVAGLTTYCALANSACGGQSDYSRAQSEVRALFTAAAADGRTGRFATICTEDYSGLLKQLDYLFKIDCAKDLKAEWAEGVQYAHVGPSTRIVVSGKSATVFDGGTPDRAYLTRSGWRLVEFPRNRRHTDPNEVQEVIDKLNPGFRKQHLPLLGPETSAPPAGLNGAG